MKGRKEEEIPSENHLGIIRASSGKWEKQLYETVDTSETLMWAGWLLYKILRIAFILAITQLTITTG